MVELGTFNIKEYDPRMEQGEKQAWREEVIVFANKFIGTLPDDTLLISLMPNTSPYGGVNPAWVAYLGEFGNDARHAVTKYLGMIARFLRSNSEAITLGKARLYDEDTLEIIPGIGDEGAKLIVALVKPIKAAEDPHQAR